MKTMLAAAAAAAVLGAAGAAAAQQTVSVGGNAPVLCTLPASYAFVSGNAGATSGQYSFQVWNIPSSALSTASGMPVTGDGYAIRVRGTASCNTAHKIAVQSARGGLAQGNQGAAAPNGFSNRRAMTYQAYWSNGAASSATPVGPVAGLSSVITPGQLSTSDGQTPKSSAPFDVVMSVQRPASTTPLVAGYYWDTLTVTLTPGS